MRTKSGKKRNEIKYRETKLKEKQTKKMIKKNNNQENEYHIWYNNKTKSMKMKKKSKTKKEQLKERGS